MSRTADEWIEFAKAEARACAAEEGQDVRNVNVEAFAVGYLGGQCASFEREIERLEGALRAVNSNLEG